MGKSLLYVAGTIALSARVHAKLDNIIPVATATLTLPNNVFDEPRATKPPVLEVLEKRQTASRETTSSLLVAPDNICGYIEGRPGVPFSCPEDWTCKFRPADDVYYGNVKCCQGDLCGYRIACMDFEQVSISSECGSGCMLDNLTVKCTNTAQPYCNTVSFTSDILDYWCNSFFDNSTQTAFTTFEGQTGRTWDTVLLTTNSEETATASEHNTRTNPTTDATVDPAATDITVPSGNDDDDDDNNGNSPNNTTNNNNNGGSSTPIGPIVGGVLGGVAVIAAVGFGIWFILRRRRREQEEANGGIPPQEVQQLPPQGPYSPGPEGYAPGPGYSPNPGHQYYDPNKGAYASTYAQSSPSPGYPQTPQPQHLAPGGYYPPNGTPDRYDTVSPSGVSNSNASAHRLSTVSTQVPPVQQQYAPPGPAYGSGPGGYAPVPQNPQQPTIYEAPGPNDGHHRGQMHEMA